MKNALIFLSFLLFLPALANAVIIERYSWGYVEEIGSVPGVPVEVWETFYTHDEIVGTAMDLTPGIEDNLFAYELANTAPSWFTEISLFSVANPYNMDRTLMVAPEGWSERTGAQNYIWETFDPSYGIGEGENLAGFKLFSTAGRGVLDPPPFDRENVGWVMFGFGDDSVNALGSVSGPAPVPEPATMLLLGTGIAGLLGLGRKKFFKRK